MFSTERHGHALWPTFVKREFPGVYPNKRSVENTGNVMKKLSSILDQGNEHHEASVMAPRLA
jgi:hypothetical protein